MALPDAPSIRDQTRSLTAQVLSRQGLIALGCLVVLCGLAWWWLWRMGMPSPAKAMPDMDGMAGMDMPAAPNVWSSTYLGATFIMWAIMMVAMMLPSAAPMILLHDTFSRRNRLGPAATTVFGLSYLALWALFAAVAALAQAALVSAGVVDDAALAFGNRWIAAALLTVAALYQLSPLKRLCLSHCQSPVGFLTRHWQPGIDGALAMGLRHGAYCVGCCWPLMLLLFVGGVMNLAWIALLTAVVLAEKYAPPTLRADRLLAAILAIAAVMVVVPL